MNLKENNTNYFILIVDANELLVKIEPYYILILVTVGLIGNTLSFAIFLSSRLKLVLFYQYIVLIKK